VAKTMREDAAEMEANEVNVRKEDEALRYAVHLLY
jgi:hypothetical protein